MKYLYVLLAFSFLFFYRPAPPFPLVNRKYCSTFAMFSPNKSEYGESEEASVQYRRGGTDAVF